MLKHLFLLAFLFPILATAQFTYSLDQSIPVTDGDDNELNLAWGGGLNAAQFNTMDIDGDNMPDLIVFDRMANKVITFLRKQNRYIYSPEYQGLFPELSNWMLLRDFNCDGKKDIFTGNVLGIKVYRNVTSQGQSLQWEDFLFFNAVNNSVSSVLLTKGFSGKTNLQLQFDDLPAIADMDNDGDLDILAFRYPGGSTVELHKNFGMERYGICDSLDFERVTQSYGNFTECECGTFAFDSAACPPHGGERVRHSGGKALTALDIDNDQDADLLISEAECNNVFLLPNEGDADNPVFSSASTFPSSHPVDLTTFPAVFYEDADFDDIPDLIASPNIFSKESNETDLKHSSWFYKNTGTEVSPVFAFVQNNFLQASMIDVGDNAVPASADVDGDGDMDLFISHGSDDNVTGSIYFYENAGSKELPSFKLISDDYAGLSERLGYPAHNIRMQFSDINSDARPDLIFTATSLNDNRTSLYYILNQASGSLNFSGAAVNTITATNITFSENVHITDVNNDGLADMLIGRNNGSLEYWKNNGPKGSVNFSLEARDYLNIDDISMNQSIAITTADLNADGKSDLVIGALGGSLTVISNYKEAGDTPNILTDILFDPLSGVYKPASFAGRVWSAVANLFNANKPAIIVGNTLGGLHVLRNDDGKSLPGEIAIDIYPTLLLQGQVMNIVVDRPGSAQILSVTGQQLLHEGIPLEPHQVYPVNLSFLAKGIYLVRVNWNNKSYTRRIAIH